MINKDSVCQLNSVNNSKNEPGHATYLAQLLYSKHAEKFLKKNQELFDVLLQDDQLLLPPEDPLSLLLLQ